MKTFFKNFFLLFAMVSLLYPSIGSAQATKSLELSAWVPYWRSQKGVDSISPNLGIFTEVNPFMYTVKLDGSLNQASSLGEAEWVTLKAQAKQLGVRFIPTITWANADAMDEIFRDPIKRQAHIKAIIREVFGNGLDGIDIDYEGKYAKTRPYFSLFLKELNEAMGFNKWIMCTIEARTPLDSRYSKPESIPKDIEYANDFTEINKYCDRVRIMAYDQGRFDLKLNDANEDPYVPVADVAWVEKVVRLAMEEIDKNKIIIGVPTYGYEYDMFEDLNGGGEMQYSRLWSFNPGYAVDIAKKLNLQPTRNSAGELFLTFPASQSPEPSIPLPFATRVLSWSDAEAIRQKAELAHTLGVRGIGIFKIDGGEDPLIWNLLPEYQDKSTRVATKPPVVALSQEVTETPTVITVSTTLPAKDLQYGDRVEDVRALQKFLNDHYFYVAKTGGGSPGNETTFFGPATHDALVRFQKANNITPSAGYYGPKTRAKMNSI